jgi:hypothetical protein
MPELSSEMCDELKLEECLSTFGARQAHFNTKNKHILLFPPFPPQHAIGRVTTLHVAPRSQLIDY